MDKCWGCGETKSSEDNYSWVCGTMKAGAIRGAICYDRELAAKDALLREAKKLFQGYLDYSATRIRFNREAQAFLNLPEIKKLEGSDG